MAEAHRLSPNSAVIGIAQVAVHWFCGDTTRARAVLRSVEQRPDARRSTIYIAMAHAGMGQLDSAFAWLAREDRWGWWTVRAPDVSLAQAVAQRPSLSRYAARSRASLTRAPYRS